MIAPMPRAMNTVPTAVSVVPQSAASALSVDPRATKTMPQTPMALA